MQGNKIFKKDLKKYYSSIRKALICSCSMKSAFLTQFKTNVVEFIEGNNINSIDPIIKEFGTYEEISNSLYTDYDIEKLKKRARRNNIYRILCFFFVFFTILLLLYLLDEIVDAGAFKIIANGKKS